MVFVVLGKVLPHKLEEQFTKTVFCILAIWCVEPYNLSVSVFWAFELLLLKRIDEKYPLSFGAV